MKVISARLLDKNNNKVFLHPRRLHLEAAGRAAAARHFKLEGGVGEGPVCE